MSNSGMRVRFDVAGGDLRPRYLNDAELPNWENGPTMVQYLNHMSEEGWRLVTQLRGQEYVFEPSSAFQRRQATGSRPNARGLPPAGRRLDSLDPGSIGLQREDQE
jgi:hypothetical protein